MRSNIGIDYCALSTGAAEYKYNGARLGHWHLDATFLQVTKKIIPRISSENSFERVRYDLSF